MNKYESRAKALLSGIEATLRTIRECMARKGVEFIPTPDTENNAAYRDSLLDVQLLFYCYDPQIPLYAEAMSLNRRMREIEGDPEDYARYDDFNRLKYLLEKYLSVLAFRKEP